MSEVTATEARATLPEILDRVGDGDEVTITRHGRPVAVIIRPDALRSRRAEPSLRRADEIAALLDRASEMPPADVAGLSPWARRRSGRQTPGPAHAVIVSVVDAFGADPDPDPDPDG